MAIPNRSTNPLCHFLSVLGVITLVPLNADAKAAIDAWFTTYGAYTTVAITQAGDAGQGGINQTGPYTSLVLTCSA